MADSAIRDPGTSAGYLVIGFASDRAEVFRAGLAAHAVDLRFEGKLLAFIERAHAGALDGADVHEHVVAAVVRLNKAEALGRVEPLNCSGCHFNFSKMRKCASCPHDLRAGLHPISAMSWGGEPVRRYQQGESIIRMGRVYAALPDIASDKRVQRNIQ